MISGEDTKGKRKKNRRKGRKKDTRTKNWFGGQKKENGKQKKMILPLRFWEAYQIGYGEAFKIDGTIYKYEKMYGI